MGKGRCCSSKFSSNTPTKFYSFTKKAPLKRDHVVNGRIGWSWKVFIFIIIP